MKSRPGDIFRNINRNVGVGRFTKDTYVKQHVPPPPIQEEVQEEIIEEINSKVWIMNNRKAGLIDRIESNCFSFRTFQNQIITPIIIAILIIH